MATAEQIAALRSYINEPTQVRYTDAVLSPRIDAAASLEALAATIWREKASSYAELVDVKEGSSERALGDLYTQANAMAAAWNTAAGTPTVSQRPARTRRIERP